MTRPSSPIPQPGGAPRSYRTSLGSLLQRAVLDDRFWITPIVRMEILYSARTSSEYAELEHELDALRILRNDRAVADAATSAIRELAARTDGYQRPAPGTVTTASRSVGRSGSPTPSSAKRLTLVQLESLVRGHPRARFVLQAGRLRCRKYVRSLSSKGKRLASRHPRFGTWRLERRVRVVLQWSGGPQVDRIVGRSCARAGARLRTPVLTWTRRAGWASAGGRCLAPPARSGRHPRTT